MGQKNPIYGMKTPNFSSIDFMGQKDPIYGRKNPTYGT